MDASRNNMRTLGVIRLLIRVGNLKVGEHYLVCTNLAKSCLLGTMFIYMLMKAIYPQRKQVASHQSRTCTLRTVAALFQINNVHLSFMISDNSIFNKIGVAQAVSKPPMIQAEIEVTGNGGGLLILQLSAKAVKKLLMLMVNGVMELMGNRFFGVLVSNC